MLRSDRLHYETGQSRLKPVFPGNQLHRINSMEHFSITNSHSAADGLQQTAKRLTNSKPLTKWFLFQFGSPDERYQFHTIHLCLHYHTCTIWCRSICNHQL